MSAPPEDAVCVVCHSRPATTERVTGISMGAPDVDGMPDPDGFTWHTEWVCDRHKGDQ